VIRREGNRYLIKDLESANGTYVNGAQVKEMQLYGDDVIKIGNTEFKFVALSENYVKRQTEFSDVAAAAAGPEITMGGGEIIRPGPAELEIPEINLPPPTDGGAASGAGGALPFQVPASSLPQPPPPPPGMTGLYSAPGLQPVPGMPGIGMPGM